MEDLESIATEKVMPDSEIEKQGKISKRLRDRAIGSLALICAGTYILLANPVFSGVVVIGGSALTVTYIKKYLNARDYLIEAGVEDRYS